MSETTKLTTLLVLLVLLFGAVGWVVSYQQILENREDVFEKKSSIVKQINVITEKEVSSNKKQIVTDRYVATLDKDGVIVAISSDGEAYNVRSGTVLADSMVISSNEEDYSVQRLDNERFSTSSN